MTRRRSFRFSVGPREWSKGARIMYLVTGGAGFIGSHLAARLVADGAAVRVFDNFSSGSQDNLAAIAANIGVVDRDIRDEAAVRRATSGVEVGFHQAADPSVPRSVVDPRMTYDVNVTGTLNVLLAARDASCLRLQLCRIRR